jgi:hypothetical protein
VDQKEQGQEKESKIAIIKTQQPNKEVKKQTLTKQDVLKKKHSNEIPLLGHSLMTFEGHSDESENETKQGWARMKDLIMGTDNSGIPLTKMVLRCRHQQQLYGKM